MIFIKKQKFFYQTLPVLLAAFLMVPALLSLPAFAGVTGTEGGVSVSSDYNVSAGGSVKLFYGSSKDLILVGGQKPAEFRLVTGEAAGKYPTVADLGDSFVAQGWIAIDHLEIKPAAGYAIGELIVDGGSKGAVTSYKFTPKSGTPAESMTYKIEVRFKTAASPAALSSCRFFWPILLAILFLLILILLFFFLRKSRKKHPEEEEDAGKKETPPVEKENLT